MRTASITQVREPLYATSVGRWRRYGPAIQPLWMLWGGEPRYLYRRKSL